MKQNCKLNKQRDLGPVITGLAPDIQKMIDSHTIPTTSAQVVYNQIEDIKQVGFRINDDFDAIMAQRALQKGMNGLNTNKGTGSSQPAGQTAPISDV